MANGCAICIVVTVVVIIVGALIIGLVSSSLRRLESDEIGLQYNSLTKDLDNEVKSEGLHTGAVGYSFVIFPSTFETLDLEIECLNRDGVDVQIDISFQYRVQNKRLYDIVVEFKDYEEYRDVLKWTATASIYQASSLFNTSQFQSERGRFQTEVGDQLVARFTDLHCDVADVQVNNIQRPRAYDSAVQDKEAAKENIRIAESERAKRLIQAETQRDQAAVNAQVNIAKAESQARTIVNRAQKQAEAILHEYEIEADVYERIIAADGLDLTTEGFLSYIGVRTISSAVNPVYIGMAAPAKSSYVES